MARHRNATLGIHVTGSSSQVLPSSKALAVDALAILADSHLKPRRVTENARVRSALASNEANPRGS